MDLLKKTETKERVIIAQNGVICDLLEIIDSYQNLVNMYMEERSEINGTQNKDKEKDRQ